jgi:hypothetical protein
MEQIMINKNNSVFNEFKDRIKIIRHELLEASCCLYLIIDKHLLTLISLYRAMQEELKTKAYSFKKFKCEEQEILRVGRFLIEAYLMSCTPTDEEVVETFIKYN